MEHSEKSQFSKRYIVENSIPKVTSDGEPHEVMTLVAACSGLVAAFVILGILVSLIGCKGRKRRVPASTESGETPKISAPISLANPYVTSIIETEKSDPKLTSVSVVSNSVGNINPAFSSSEFDLTSKTQTSEVALELR